MNADLTPRVRNRKFRDTRFDVSANKSVPVPNGAVFGDERALQGLPSDSVPGDGVVSRMTQNENENKHDQRRIPEKVVCSIDVSQNKTAKSRILLIEDSPCIQKVMVRWLEREGCEVTLAENGLVGLNYLKSKQFDVCLVDFSMVSW
jgi:PleD family two-component response regulator